MSRVGSGGEGLSRSTKGACDGGIVHSKACETAGVEGSPVSASVGSEEFLAGRDEARGTDDGLGIAGHFDKLDVAGTKVAGVVDVPRQHLGKEVLSRVGEWSKATYVSPATYNERSRGPGKRELTRVNIAAWAEAHEVGLVVEAATRGGSRE